MTFNFRKLNDANLTTLNFKTLSGIYLMTFNFINLTTPNFRTFNDATLNMKHYFENVVFYPESFLMYLWYPLINFENFKCKTDQHLIFWTITLLLWLMFKPLTVNGFLYILFEGSLVTMNYIHNEASKHAQLYGEAYGMKHQHQSYPPQGLLIQPHR